MVRNDHIVGFAEQPVPSDSKPDTHITIEGGIWTTLANGVNDNNGNQRGSSSKQNPVPGTHGVILLHNVRHVTVSNFTVSGVRVGDAQTDLPIEQVVHVIEQKLNPDHPKTTPKGGTGKGIWMR